MEPPLAKRSSPWTERDLIRLSLGYIYFHFGFLKFFPDLSPAEILASYTSMKISGFMMDASSALLAIAVFECLIGLGFLFEWGMKWVGVMFGLHMLGTFLPLFLLPEFTYKFFPFAPTTEGQYILKNLVLITAGWAVLAPYYRRSAHPDASTGLQSSNSPV